MVQVVLTPSPGGISFHPNPQCDPTAFPSLEDFAAHIAGSGYYGGVRLLMAMVKRLHCHCSEHGIALDPSKGFYLAYSTTIPRQRGLSGSSAIACAALNCLLAHYQLEDAIPAEVRPQLVLSAEAELGITAGLQDRVIQVYGGVVYMDFDPHLEAPRYISLNATVLPPLYLMYRRTPSGKDSGTVHSGFKQRWAAGDPQLREDMQEVAALAAAGKSLLTTDPVPLDQLASLMQRNICLRRSMFGDDALGADNLHMVHVAEGVGAAAKFTGSGGACVALCPQGEAQRAQLLAACEAEGIACEPVVVAPARFIAS